MVQTTLAERWGRKQTFVSNVELAIRWLDLIELRDYCAGLDINLRDMLDRWEARIYAGTQIRTRQVEAESQVVACSTMSDFDQACNGQFR